MNTCPKFWNS